MVNGPLTGVRVLDLTHVWAGPLGARFLADLGAEVVCIEAPFGRGPRVFPEEPMGGWMGGEPAGEPWNRNALFVKLHRNRRSVCVDLKQPQGKALLLRLAAEADVLMENFSAGTLDDLGLGYDALREANPQLIYLALPGFGDTGPYSRWLAFGPTVEAMSGLTQMMGYEDGEVRNSSTALNDPMTGTHAAAAVAEALRRRRRVGHGERVELTLHGSGVAFSGPWLVAHQLGEPLEPRGNGHPDMSPHGVYPCAGADAWIGIACEDDTVWQHLAALVGADARLNREHRAAAAADIDRQISTWTRQRDKHAACLELQAAGVAAGPVNAAADMLADVQAGARGYFDFAEPTGERMPGNPITMTGLDSSAWRPCPKLGEDNASVLLDWLGMSGEDVEQLAGRGVLHDAPPA